MPKKVRDGNPGMMDRGEEAGRLSRAAADARQRLKADLLLQDEINAALESLADSLPAIADLRLARTLATIIDPAWQEHVAFQDEALFPTLVASKGMTQDAIRLLKRLHVEHAEIRDRHGELAQHIELLLAGRLVNSDMFGYMLRSLFDARRRHTEAESAVVSLMEQILTATDLATLDAWHAKRPRPPFPVTFVLGTRH